MRNSKNGYYSPAEPRGRFWDGRNDFTTNKPHAPKTISLEENILEIEFTVRGYRKKRTTSACTRLCQRLATHRTAKRQVTRVGVYRCRTAQVDIAGDCVAAARIVDRPGGGYSRAYDTNIFGGCNASDNLSTILY